MSMQNTTRPLSSAPIFMLDERCVPWTSVYSSAALRTCSCSCGTWLFGVPQKKHVGVEERIAEHCEHEGGGTANSSISNISKFSGASVPRFNRRTFVSSLGTFLALRTTPDAFSTVVVVASSYVGGKGLEADEDCDILRNNEEKNPEDRLTTFATLLGPGLSD